jgi:hypothetical protein
VRVRLLLTKQIIKPEPVVMVWRFLLLVQVLSMAVAEEPVLMLIHNRAEQVELVEAEPVNIQQTVLREMTIKAAVEAAAVMMEQYALAVMVVKALSYCVTYPLWER